MVEATDTQLQTITADELKQWIKSDNTPVIINALNSDAYRARHIPGSINIPEETIDTVKTVVPDNKQRVVVYCADKSCQASPRAAEKMMEMGYEKVYDFEAGLAGWRKAGYELTGNS